MPAMERLPLLKALGDNTRYAIYLEIARSPSPRSTAEIADTLGLHPNTVRPHLERMRDVGLLDVEVDYRGAVGRPQHRYGLAAEAPSLGMEPPAFPLLASLLAAVAVQARPAAEDVAEVGRVQGRDQGRSAATRARREDRRDRTDRTERTGRTDASACVRALLHELAALGYDPASDTDPSGPLTTIAFTHCPYRDLAEAYPELVCHLHRGLVEGFVSGFGEARPADTSARNTVEEFHTLADRSPCQVAIRSHYAGSEPS